MLTATIADQIKNAGADYARFSTRDTGMITAKLFDADDIEVGSIIVTKRQINKEERRGLLKVTYLYDNARDPRYQWRVTSLTVPGWNPPRKYQYIRDLDPNADEKRCLGLAHKLGLRLTYGVGGGLRRLHEDDWQSLQSALADSQQ